MLKKEKEKKKKKRMPLSGIQIYSLHFGNTRRHRCVHREAQVRTSFDSRPHIVLRSRNWLNIETDKYTHLYVSLTVNCPNFKQNGQGTFFFYGVGVLTPRPSLSPLLHPGLDQPWRSCASECALRTVLPDNIK